MTTYGIHGSNPVRAEYASGYADGYAQGAWLIQDQRAAAVPNAIAEAAEWAKHAASPYSRAHALGVLRGLRHADRDVRLGEYARPS